jgi:hypothetical protein
VIDSKGGKRGIAAALMEAMNKSSIASFVLAAAIAAPSAFALNTGRYDNNNNYNYQSGQQYQQQDKQALRQAINAKRREYQQLRKANDPRAQYAKQELDALNAQWHAQNGKGRGHAKQHGNGNGHDRSRG